MVVGAIGLLDLRLLGYGRRIPAQALSGAVTPLAVAGFGVMVLSGAILFLADARALAGSPLFLCKLVLILLAGLNAALFRWRFNRLLEAPPVIARALAAGSLGLWLGVTVLGRLIAYF